MSKRETDTSYEVGYGKPPKSTRFRKGQSGNPKGRPKGAVGLLSSIEREMNARVPIKENGKLQSATKNEVIAKQLVNKAVAGDLSSINAIARLTASTRGSEGAVSNVDHPEFDRPVTPVDWDILRDFFGNMSEEASIDCPEAGLPVDEPSHSNLREDDDERD